MFGWDHVLKAVDFVLRRKTILIPITIEDTDSAAEIVSAKTILMARPDESLSSAAKRNVDEIIRLDREVRQMRYEIFELKRTRTKKNKIGR